MQQNETHTPEEQTEIARKRALREADREWIAWAAEHLPRACENGSERSITQIEKLASQTFGAGVELIDGGAPDPGYAVYSLDTPWGLLTFVGSSHQVSDGAQL